MTKPLIQEIRHNGQVVDPNSTITLECDLNLDTFQTYDFVERKRIWRTVPAGVHHVEVTLNLFEIIYDVARSAALNKSRRARALNGGVTAKSQGRVDGDKQQDPAAKLCAERIGKLNISVRTLHALETEGIATVGDLLDYSAKQLRNVHHIGVVAFREVHESLARLGLKLKNE